MLNDRQIPKLPKGRHTDARQRTFAAALEAAYAVKAESTSNAKYRKQWHALVARYALPKLGELPIAEILAGVPLVVQSEI